MKDRSARSVLQSVMEDRRVPYLLSAVLIVLGIVLAATDFTLNDEGLFTFMSATHLRHAFVATFFMQKAKPVLSIFYLLPAWLGLTPFFVVHVLVAALAPPLAAAVARAMGIAAPNFAAFVITVSPLYLFGAPAGLANTDGVVGVLLFLYLLVAKKQSLAAGLLLGTLPWVRAEMSVFAMFVVAFLLLVNRDLRAVAGVLVFPVLYWLLGWWYHHDWFWILRYGPTTPEPPGITAHNPMMPLFHLKATFSNTLPFILAVSPVVPLMLIPRRKVLTPIEWLLLGYSIVWLTLSIILPFFQLANFGFVPRYMLPILPATALLAARAVGLWRQGERPGLLWLTFAGVFLISLGLIQAQQHEPALVTVVCVAAFAALYILRGQADAAIATALALMITAPVLLPTQVSRKELAEYLPETEHWLREHRQEIHGPIYTSSLLLGPYLLRKASDLKLDIRYLLAVDQLADAMSMLNKDNGQLDEAKRAFKEGSIPGATSVWTADLRPSDVPADAIFAFRPKDQRIQLTLPQETWAAHLQPMAAAGCDFYRFVP